MTTPPSNSSRFGKEAAPQFQSALNTDWLGGVVLRDIGVAYGRAASRNPLYSRYLRK